MLAALAFVLADSLKDPVIRVGDKAPPFSIVTESGKTLTRDDFGGKLLVLNFWATWCPPCVEEMPSLNQFQQALKDSGVVVLAVSVDKNEAAYKQFLQRYGLQFEVGRDAKADIPAVYGTFQYPETYIVSSKGEVLEKLINQQDWASPQLIQRIKGLM